MNKETLKVGEDVNMQTQLFKIDVRISVLLCEVKLALYLC